MGNEHTYNYKTLFIWRLHLITLEAQGTKRGDLTAVVVIASTEEQARMLSAQCLSDDTRTDSPRSEYLDPERTRCTKLGFAINGIGEGVVVADYDYDYDSIEYPWI